MFGKAPGGPIIESGEVLSENAILERFGFDSGKSVHRDAVVARPEEDAVLDGSSTPRIIGGFSLGKSPRSIRVEGAVEVFVDRLGHGPYPEGPAL